MSQKGHLESKMIHVKLTIKYAQKENETEHRKTTNDHVDFS